VKPGPKSIAARLALGLLLGASVVLAGAGAFLYNEVRTIVMGSLDRTLHSKLQLITGLLHEEHGGIELELSEIIAGEYVIPRSGHYYRVFMDGTVLAASPSLVDEDFVFIAGERAPPAGPPRESIYTSMGPDDEPVRVLRYQHAALDRNFDITLAESLVDSFAMIATFRRFLLTSIPLAVLVLCSAAWLIAKASLRPLASFSGTIEAITHENLAERIDAGTTVRELARLARSFNAMLDRLSTVFESQKRLVADASHELKTPLSVIRTQCDVALQRARSAEEYAATLRAVRLSSRSMTRLIDDLLSLARLDAGLLAPQGFARVPLGECIREAIRMTAAMAAERRVTATLDADAALAVAGSRSALCEVFLNLIENAIRYNVEEGTVTVAAREDGGRAVITVADTGVGMEERDLGRIFERFYRAGTARSTEGTGLGLSIVRSVVEAHAGTIKVESEPNKGSRFTIMLPLAGAGERTAV
jgi:heavy metal sensor kinase